MYDSSYDTKQHIDAVRENIMGTIHKLYVRAINHDVSKLENPEKSMYDEFTPKLKLLTYGSDEYKETLLEMGVAIKHHYENNRHHPEHYPNGINGMNLLDLIEMVADWKAASTRHANGSMEDSLKINKERFGISDQLLEILSNTVKEMRW
jgi:hypothetical protein